MTTAIAAGRGGITVPVASVIDAADQAARHEPISPGPHETDIAAVTWRTSGRQPAATILERHVNLPRVVLTLDTANEPDKGRWTDWLHTANVLQHLDQNAVLSTTRTYTPEAAAQSIAESASEPQAIASELLADVFDQAALSLAEAAVAEGWSELVVDYPAQDHDDTPIEVAWPNSKVGILPSGITRPLTLADWDLRTPDAWSVQELLDALAQGAG